MNNFEFKKQAIALALLMSTANMSVAAPKTDFNGDGKADVFLKNVFSGALSSWLVTGTAVTSKPSYGTVSPSTGFTTIGIKDVNGDGKSDLIWYNVTSGSTGAWLMNGDSVLSSASYGGFSPNTGWKINSLTDFNRDGKYDLFWYNIYSGEMQIWYLNGSVISNKVSFTALPPQNGWYPIGFKDLNANGYPDMLIYNPYSGGVSSRLDNGVLANYGAVNPNTGWSPIGLEDMNGDKKADLLWRNQYSGAISAWLINGTVIASQVTLGTNAPNNGWSIAGYADFNGDSKTDILWYSAYTGGTITWLSGVGSINFGTLAPSAGWQPMGLDDFNGDGKADLLWHNQFTNTTTTWLLSGTGISQTASYGSIPASSVWTINIPR